MSRFREYSFIDGTGLKVGTMYCIGRNYAEHAREMGNDVPSDPIVFIKPPAAYVPDGGLIELPDFSDDVHHELELVVVIGKDCRNIHEGDAENFIAGFAVGIDVTLRDVQQKAKKDGTPWAVAKGFYSSAPISKVVPIGLLKNGYDNIHIDLFVNDELRQSGDTGTMERPVGKLISYLSKVFSLESGDCIFTGTPKGVGKIISGDKLRARLDELVELNVTVK